MHTLKHFFHTIFFGHSISNTKIHIMAHTVFEKNIPVAVNTDLKWEVIFTENIKIRMFIS
jgi:hypothetical protein